MQGWLIALQAKDVIRTLFDEGTRDALLAPDRVDRHDRTAQVEERNEPWNCGDFVRLHVRGVLPEHHLVLTHPCVDQVQRPLSVRPGECAAHGLAVDRDLLVGRRLTESPGPCDERIAE